MPECSLSVARPLAEARKIQIPMARPITAHGLSLTRELAPRDDVTADEVSEYALHFLDCKPEDLREPATALKLRQRIDRHGGTGGDYLDILARADCASGNVANAIETEEKALNSLPSASPKRSVSPLRQTIEAQLAKLKASLRLKPRRRPHMPSRNGSSVPLSQFQRIVQGGRSLP
jgi:hypothetical protein